MEGSSICQHSGTEIAASGRSATNAIEHQKLPVYQDKVCLFFPAKS
jgi:hypothetical protein